MGMMINNCEYAKNRNCEWTFTGELVLFNSSNADVYDSPKGVVDAAIVGLRVGGREVKRNKFSGDIVVNLNGDLPCKVVEIWDEFHNSFKNRMEKMRDLKKKIDILK